MGILVPLEKSQRIEWTPEMKRALLAGIEQRTSVDRLAQSIGVAPQSLILGAFEIIREIAA